MIRAGVIGATGYVGQELVRLLAQHPQVILNGVTSQQYTGRPYSDTYPHMFRIVDHVCQAEDLERMADSADVLFLALPHGLAAEKITTGVLKKARVIDLGADFRLKNGDTYTAWYNTDHPQPALLTEAVYGLTEWNHQAIRKARLVANPGCYPTCSLLCLIPLVKAGAVDADSIIIDAKSGVSGAGRGLDLGLHYTECSDSIKAYKIATHRHTPEIEQGLAEFSGTTTCLSFTPHLVPMNRGILATIYAKLAPGVTATMVRDIYEGFYDHEPFIRLLPEGYFPETRWVKGSNYCDIGFTVDQRLDRLIVVGAIDNLVKGAAGQAVHNMNLMFDLDDTIGLTAIPLFPA